VGQPRAAASYGQLATLNPYVRVGVLPEASISLAVLSRFHVVVATGAPRAQLVAWNAFCHAAQPAIAFIASDVLGAAGYAFSDFGPEHGVRDADGEINRSATVAAVIKSAAGAAEGKARTLVQCVDTKRHNMDEGSHVLFREVKGMTALNDGVPRRIVNCKAHSFELEEDSSSWPDYSGGGVIEQTKVPIKVAFASLGERIDAPVHPSEGMLCTPDLGKFGRSEQLHAAFQAVELFRAKHGGQLPPLRDAAAAAECVALAREWVASLGGNPGALALTPEEVSAEVVSRVAALARAELPALCAFFGGVVAQEVVKATGKYMPLRQWLYLDAFEVLPDDFAPPPAAGAAAGASLVAASVFGALQPMGPEFAPAGSRYDHLVAILGRSLQAKVMAQRVFVVGAGALGCEMLKNFALAGVGCGAGGSVVVTDMDRIEVSNLNRQFLFREKDVARPKSVTAAAAAKVMNPELNVSAMETIVGEDTENVFNDAFWQGLTLVTNALDNVKARQYVDGRCVLYGLPLMESGTLGTKANTQVVLPGMTETYSESVDPPDDAIPMCTLRNFPHLIEHCIEWARDLFHGSFNSSVLEASEFVEAPSAWLAKAAGEANFALRRAKLEGVLKSIEAARRASLQTCLEAARELFNNNFYLQIRQLLHNFPADYVDKATGAPFWTGTKRAPTPAAFDAADPLHLGFVVEAAALLAENFGLRLPAGWDAPAALAPLLAAIRVPDFAPKKVRIKSGEGDTTEEGGEDDGPVCEALAARLRELAEAAGAEGLRAFRFAPAEFEKDDDSNHHIAFIERAANLRARNYDIREATRFEVKMTAGKIIPAVGTTTCSVTGLVVVELYKTVARCRLEHFRNSFLNLGTNVFSMGEPAAPKRTVSKAYDAVSMGPVRAHPEGFSRWDFLEVREGSLTCRGLAEHFKRAHGLELSMLTAGALILYNPDLFKSHREERAGTPVVDVYRQVAAGKPGDKKRAAPEIAPGRTFLLLDASCSDAAGDVVVPSIKFYFA
jgi:ubiquitin-activating enzyme E1